MGLQTTHEPTQTLTIINPYKSLRNLSGCQLLFIPSDQAGRVDEIVRDLADSHTLTVGDTPGLAQQGVAINMVLVGGKLRFEVNRRALERAGLTASSQFLKLAILVDEDDAG